MANARGTKRDIDRAKKERAALKRERRQQSPSESDDSTVDELSCAVSPAPMTEGDVLEALNVLHLRFDEGKLDFDEFEASKVELFERLADR